MMHVTTIPAIAALSGMLRATYIPPEKVQNSISLSQKIFTIVYFNFMAIKEISRIN